MKIVHTISNAIETLVKVFIIATMILMSAITILEVTRRYFLGLSYPWAEELVRYLLIWLTFVGGSIAWKMRGLVYLNLLEDMLVEKAKAKAVLDLLIHVFCLAFVIFIAFNSWKHTFSPVILRRISTGLHVSMAYAYFSIPLGFVLMAFFTLERIPRIVGKCFGLEENK